MPDSPAAGPVWFRSLYWRIAMGLVGLLAGLLLLQSLIFLWMSGTIATNIMGKSPEALATQVATEVASALQQDPKLNVETFVRDRYSRYYQPLMVVLNDGRVARNHELSGVGPGGPRPGALRPGGPGSGPGLGGRPPVGSRPDGPFPAGPRRDGPRRPPGA